MKILVVEDDGGIMRMMQKALEREGHIVHATSEGPAGLDMALSDIYGLAVLDIMLPGMDGWKICDELRSAGSRVPILMVTALDMVDDRVRGLDLGADDYLPKPFQIKEFVARVRALLRRDRMHRARIIRVADLVIDTAQKRVSRGGVEIGLSHCEYELLEALAANESKVLTRDVIRDRIWMDEDSSSNTVDVCIHILRKKVDSGHDVKLIQTVRGAGYTLRVPDQRM